MSRNPCRHIAEGYCKLWVLGVSFLRGFRMACRVYPQPKYTFCIIKAEDRSFLFKHVYKMSVVVQFPTRTCVEKIGCLKVSETKIVGHTRADQKQFTICFSRRRPSTKGYVTLNASF